MIYFAQDSASCNIKIGYTGNEDVEQRIRALQTGCPSPLILLGSAEGSKEAEAELHDRFADARLNGEWFRPVPELIQFIISRVAISHAVRAVRDSMNALHDEDQRLACIRTRNEQAIEILAELRQQGRTVEYDADRDKILVRPGPGEKYAGRIRKCRQALVAVLQRETNGGAGPIAGHVG